MQFCRLPDSALNQKKPSSITETKTQARAKSTCSHINIPALPSGKHKATKATTVLSQKSRVNILFRKLGVVYNLEMSSRLFILSDISPHKNDKE